MSSEKLIQDFGHSIGLSGLTLDHDYQAAITVGERQVDMCAPPTGLFFLSTVVGTLPVHGRLEFLQNLLLANRMLNEEDYAFAVDPTSSEILLLMKAYAPTLGPSDIQQMVETIIERAQLPDLLRFEEKNEEDDQSF